ncbi:MAG: PH domain-containing protein [bacterium]
MVGEEERRHFAFHSYCIRPNIHFEGQFDDEEVLLVVRPHPISQLSWIINGFILILILILVDITLLNSLTFMHFIVINTISFVLVLSFLWFNFLAYFFNIGIITNQRLIDVDYSTVFYKDISETIYSKIEDVSAKSTGVFQSFFDYGDVYIQTAGSDNNVQFKSIHKPSQVVKTIISLIE